MLLDRKNKCYKMADRTCKTCGKKFTAPCRLARHLERKTPCAPVLGAPPQIGRPNVCIRCGRGFANTSGLAQHKRTHCRVAADCATEAAALNGRQDFEMLRADIGDLCKLLAEKLGSPHRPTHITNQQITAGQVLNATTSNVNTININVFGSEDTSHIGQVHVQKLLDDVLKTTSNPAAGAEQALMRAAVMICSDVEHIANMTCYIPNKREDSVRVKTETGAWELRPYSTVGPPLVAAAADLLFVNQPFENALKYGELMKALRDNEKINKDGRSLRTILVRNKELISMYLGSAP
jgi:hypothetical protein